MAVSGKPARNSTTPRKAAAVKKVAAEPRAPRTTRTRTSAPPPAEVEQNAIEEAVAAVPPPPARPSPTRASARAAAALRGTPEPEPVDPVEDEVTEDDAPDPDPDATAETVFKGRTVVVKLPTSEQLAIYRRMSLEFQQLAKDGGAEKMELDAALRHLDRATRLIQSILRDDVDRDWIEDMLLDGKVTLEECTGLLTDAFRRLNDRAIEQQDDQNRAARRAGSRARLED